MHTLEKKRNKKNKFKLGVCIAAFVAAISVFIILLQIEKNILAQYEKGIVCVAAEEIPKGVVITEENYRQYFDLEETDKKFITKAALTDYGQLLGLVPAFDIEKGTLISNGMFERIEDVLGSMEEPVIAGFKADDLYQVAGGILRAGDRIHIFLVTEEGASLCRENVYVQSVYDYSGQYIPNGDGESAAQRINIYLDKADTEQFYSDLARGSLRIVRVCDKTGQ